MTAFTRRFALFLPGLLLSAAVLAATPYVVDGDGDAVSDEIDDCPYTHPGVQVDAKGCPLSREDGDLDGVPDESDDCPYSAAGAAIDAKGCALDSDFDGVANGIDRCPGSGLALPLPLLFVLMLLAAALAGALLLLGPALMKARLGVDEVVTTLLLNFMVLLLVGAILDGPMKDPLAMGWPQSVGLKPELELSKLIEGTRVHTGLLWATGLALALWALLQRTVLGFDIRAVGANPKAAAFAGVPVTRTVVLVAMLSGGLAGLAGAIEVAGRTGYVTLDMSPGYGYSGIVIAMLAGLHPLGVLLASLFVAGVQVGADSMSRAVGVPTYIADVIVATSLLSVLVATLLTNYRVRRA